MNKTLMQDELDAWEMHEKIIVALMEDGDVRMAVEMRALYAIYLKMSRQRVGFQIAATTRHFADRLKVLSFD